MFLAACGSPFDGEFLWQFETKKTHRQWGVVDAQRFYLCADDVYCLEIETGRLLWELGTFGTHASAPVIAEGVLFFQCGGLYALDAATGAVLWEFWTKNWATVTPVVGAGRVYAPVGKRLYCLDAATGKRLWSVKTGSVKNAPVLIGTRLCFTSGKTIYCLDVSNGQFLWRFKVGSERVKLAAAGENLLSVGSEGLVRGHNMETGQMQWKLDKRIPFARFCVLPAGQVLISAGTLYLVNQKNGESLWAFHQNQLPVLDSRVLDNYVFARSLRGNFLCVGLHDGALIRQLHFPVGGLLLRDANDAFFLPRALSRKVICLSASVL